MNTKLLTMALLTAFMVQSRAPFLACENSKPKAHSVQDPVQDPKFRRPRGQNQLNLDDALARKDFHRAKTYLGKEVLMDGIMINRSNPIRLSIEYSKVNWVIYLKSSEVKEVAGNQAELVFVQVWGEVKGINYKRKTVYVSSIRSFVTGEHNQNP